MKTIITKKDQKALDKIAYFLNEQPFSDQLGTINIRHSVNSYTISKSNYSQLPSLFFGKYYEPKGLDLSIIHDTKAVSFEIGGR